MPKRLFRVRFSRGEKTVTSFFQLFDTVKQTGRRGNREKIAAAVGSPSLVVHLARTCDARGYRLKINITIGVESMSPYGERKASIRKLEDTVAETA